MSSSSSPATINELIHFIGEVVSERWSRCGQYTNGAALATAIRQKYPSFSYEHLGLTRLSDAIARAQQEGVVDRRTGLKHMEVGPGPALGVHAAPPNGVACVTPRQSARRFVRPDLWKAMLWFRPEQAEFLDRATGRVVARKASDETPDRATTTPDRSLVKIQPIAADVHKGWMREFVEAAKLDPAAAPIDDDRWWRAFPEWLKGHQGDRLRAWLAFRADRMIRYVEEWAEANNVPAEAVFQSAIRPDRAAADGDGLIAAPRPHRAERREAAPPAPDSPASEEAIRRGVLAAIGDMAEHELCELWLPVRVINRHFRPI